MVDSDDEVDRPPPLSPVDALEAIQNLLEGGSDAISFARHARERGRARRFNRRDIEHVLRSGTVGDARWNDRFGNWTYRVRGADLDGDELTVVIALDPAWARITIITGVLSMASERPPRRCTECGEAQRLTRATTDYPESGLDNVKLVDVPVWECGNGHQEVEIRKAEQLHGLLVNALISKPTALLGPEIRFLRKELGMSGRMFARHLGMTAEHLSRLETGRRTVSPPTSVLVRLAVAWKLTRRRRIDFPSELRPFVSEPESASDAGAHRMQYHGDTLRDEPWTSLSV